MAVALKLLRIGKKGKPFYRIVVIDHRKQPTSEYLENIGTYNPLLKENNITLKEERLQYWVKVGAIPSEGVTKLLKAKINSIKAGK